MDKKGNLVLSPPIKDSDLEMFGVKIGLNKPSMPLKYTAWGNTPHEAQEAADHLVKLLEPSPAKR